MIYAIYQYGVHKETAGVLDMYLFWRLQISVTQFANFADSLQSAIIFPGIEKYLDTKAICNEHAI